MLWVFCPNFLMLLALVPQEHRVLLAGETRHVNKIALLLHAWRHLFLPAGQPDAHEPEEGLGRPLCGFP